MTPPGKPTPIVIDALTERQLLGVDCVWCKANLTLDTRRWVGNILQPQRRLYGCLRCVVTEKRRLPVWPETGSA